MLIVRFRIVGAGSQQVRAAPHFQLAGEELNHADETIAQLRGNTWYTLGHPFTVVEVRPQVLVRFHGNDDPGDALGPFDQVLLAGDALRVRTGAEERLIGRFSRRDHTWLRLEDKSNWDSVSFEEADPSA